MGDTYRSLGLVGGGSVQPLHEGLHGHIFWPVDAWFNGVADARRLVRVALRIRLSWTADKGQHPNGLLLSAVQDGDEMALEAVHAMLHECAQDNHAEFDEDYIERLNDIFELGGSAWRVNPAGDGLERRLAAGVRDAVDKAIEDGGGSSAGRHLAAAFVSAYGPKPDPSKAYGESIKAVEAAAAPVITPNDLKSTLGRMIGAMRGSTGSFLGVPPVTPALALEMMSSLWENQTDRHGGVAPTKSVSQESAEAAVHMAASLVQWFASGAVSAA